MMDTDDDEAASTCCEATITDDVEALGSDKGKDVVVIFWDDDD